MDRALNARKVDAIPAVAVRGEGVLETFGAILMRTIVDLARRYAILDIKEGTPAQKWTEQALLGMFGSTSLVLGQQHVPQRCPRPSSPASTCPRHRARDRMLHPAAARSSVTPGSRTSGGSRTGNRRRGLRPHRSLPQPETISTPAATVPCARSSASRPSPGRRAVPPRGRTRERVRTSPIPTRRPRSSSAPRRESCARSATLPAAGSTTSRRRSSPPRRSSPASRSTPRCRACSDAWRRSPASSTRRSGSPSRAAPRAAALLSLNDEPILPSWRGRALRARERGARHEAAARLRRGQRGPRAGAGSARTWCSGRPRHPLPDAGGAAGDGLPLLHAPTPRGLCPRRSPTWARSRAPSPRPSSSRRPWRRSGRRARPGAGPRGHRLPARPRGRGELARRSARPPGRDARPARRPALVRGAVRAARPFARRVPCRSRRASLLAFSRGRSSASPCSWRSSWPSCGRRT